MNTSADSARLPSLDGLRGVAATLVVLAHAGDATGGSGLEWLEHLRSTLTGFLGVQIFFVISGFIITRLLLREKAHAVGVSLRGFWMRRALRIIPPVAVYLACLEAMRALGVLQVGELSQLASLLFFRNHVSPDDWFNTHYWSLSVEEQFYLLWPVAVAFLAPSVLKRIAWAVVGTALAGRVVLQQGWLEPDAWRWLPMHTDALMAGALAAMWMHERPGLALRPLTGRERAWHLAAACGTLLLCRASSTPYGPWLNPPQGSAVAALTAVWIVRLVSVRAGALFAVLNSRPLVALGLVSYSVYIWQQLFTAPSHHWPHGTVPWWAGFPQSIAFSVAAGALSYAMVERPAQWLRQRLSSPVDARQVR